MKTSRLTAILAVALASAWIPLDAAAANTYDLTSDWAANANPNGVWAYKQGSNLLPWFAALIDGTRNNTQGIGGGYSPANTAGHFNPEMFLAAGSGQFASNPIDYHAGDVISSSVDSGNGNPAAGEATITWTSPFTGMITYSGAVWYAQSNVQRSNDFTFKDLSTGATLASGTISSSNGFNRANPLTYSSSSPIAVNLGDVLALTISRSSGQAAASYTGLRLTITQVVPSSTVILPQLVFGGGWYSALYFTNTTNAPATFTVNYFADDGTPLTIPSQSGSATAVTLAARGTVVIEAPNSGSLSQGYATASLPAGVTGYGVFRQSVAGVNDQEAVVPLSGSTATTSTLVFDNTAYTTAVAIVNLTNANNTITAVAYDNQGNIIGTGSLSLAPNAKNALALTGIPGLAGLNGQLGSIDFTAGTGNLAVLGLRFNGTAFTSIPTTDR